MILRQQTEAVPEIPAARPLAEVAADRAHGANLRAGDAFRSVRQGGILGTNGLVFQEFFHGDERADGHSFSGGMNAIQACDILDIHDALGCDDIFLHQAEQVGAAGKHGCVVPVGAKESKHFLFGARMSVFKAFH